MGYFANGCEAESYESKYCDRCTHKRPAVGSGCMVWMLHVFHSYEDCNKPDSYLHKLIPRTGVGNGECTMFHKKEKAK